MDDKTNIPLTITGNYSQESDNIGNLFEMEDDLCTTNMYKYLAFLVNPPQITTNQGFF
jgi:hypothetical protein